IIPGFDDLAISDSCDGHAGEVNRRVRRRKTEMIAGVLASNTAASRDQIALGYLIFYYDFNVRKGAAELTMERQESRGPTQWHGRIIRQAMRDAIVSEYFRDGVCAPLIPNLFEPATNQGLVFFQGVV